MNLLNFTMKYKINKTIIYCFVLIVNSLSLFGQVDVQLNYECSDDLQLFLVFPDGKVKQLTDTSKKREYCPANYLHDTGKYELKVVFESKKLKKDTVNYSFELNGEETDILIVVSLKNEIHGHILIAKYCKPSNDISIFLSDVEPSEDADILLPYFTLINNSKDTLYGLYYGHFWGSISIVNNDSTWSRKIGGTTDGNCASRLPLYPDSVTFATVGTWGYRSNLPKNEYKYELLYTIKKRNVYEHSECIEKSNLTWNAATETYYRLIYEFEIE